MSARPTLLIVSFHFAPSPLVGAKRFSFLAREFTRQGFDVHVVTNEIRESAYGREDKSLPLQGTVHRVPDSIDNFVRFKERGRGWRRFIHGVARRLLSPVGLDYFWAGAATRRALKIARDLSPGVVIATSPPHAALIAGERIARKLGWPLLLDYRDPWSGYDWPEWHRNGLTQWLGRRIETRLVKRSAARVLNTPSMRQWFERTFPFASPAKNFVVPNGFDSVPTKAQPAAEGPLRIVHAGEIYGSRSVVPLLRAIQSLSERHPRPIRLTTFGALPAAERLRIQEARLEAFVEELPRIPFANLFPELQRAHVLLAIVSEHMTYSTPYKVYDYMASGRPILALAPMDAALHDLLAESGAGESVDPRDIPGIEQALERLLFAPAAANAARIERYRWVNLAQQYRGAIESVVAPRVHEPAPELPARAE